VSEHGHNHGKEHHHGGPLAAENLLSYATLDEQFGTHDIIGARYHAVLNELAQIVEHQWRSGIRRGLIKGFFLSGPPGTGKTTLARRLAYELGRRFAAPPAEPPIVMALVDGSEIARSRYGESEERIRDIFAHAQAGFTTPGERAVLLFDDVESILMARGSEHVKEWHFSQDSVFFHAVDELDTSRAVVVLTTNRPDLVDDAIRDRFLEYKLDYPGPNILIEVALNIAREQKFTSEQLTQLKKRLRKAAKDGEVKSLREAQRFVIQQYLRHVSSRA
jgi:SpoVK/Ycf46/Vps4 family AAA+-type ATPase